MGPGNITIEEGPKGDTGDKGSQGERGNMPDPGPKGDRVMLTILPHLLV